MKKVRFSRTLFAAAAFMAMSAAAFSQPDIIIRDCPSDVGSSPSGCWPWYYSPDVWVRQQPDGFTNFTDQAPIAGQDAWVYVRLTNIGSDDPCCGTAHIYYRDASTGFANWPVHWVNFIYNSVLRADELGTVDVCNIPAGGSQIIELKWSNVQANLYGGSHHCLLVRWVADCDPMQVPEGTDIGQNVINNNNIVHKNCIPTLPAKPRTSVSVFNSKDHDVRARLKFRGLEAKDGRTLFGIGGFKLRVHLDDDLWAAWDGTGEDIDVIEDEHVVVIAGDATIEGLNLPAANGDEYVSHEVEVEVVYPAGNEGDATVVYPVAVEQSDDEIEADGGTGDGVVFEVHLTDDDIGGRRNLSPVMSALAEKLELTARPSISNGSTTISYTLPSEGTATLAIYDASGRLVRTLVASQSQSAGHHEVTWNGATESGAQVANGTYFYRLVTPEGTAENQIKIVR